jgi:hypothetical protein
MFAAGGDPVAIAARIGDTVETVLSTYAHEYDAARRRRDESATLASLYDRGNAMVTTGVTEPQLAGNDAPADLALARGIRSNVSKAQ